MAVRICNQEGSSVKEWQKRPLRCGLLPRHAWERILEIWTLFYQDVTPEPQAVFSGVPARAPPQQVDIAPPLSGF